MEQAKIIFELLEKVNFSFWQIFGLVIVIIFFKPIANLIDRINSFKNSMLEMTFSENNTNNNKTKIESSFVREMEKIRNITATSQNTNQEEIKNEIIQSLQSYDRKLLINALKEIKNNTRFVWPALEIACDKKITKIKEPIRLSTFFIIRSYLDLLKYSGLINYNYKYTGDTRDDATLSIAIKINNGLFELMDCMKKNKKKKQIEIIK